MTRQTRTIFGLALGAWLTMLLPTTAPVQAAETRDLILAAYSVPKEAYERHIIPAFQRHWKQKNRAGRACAQLLWSLGRSG